MQALTDKLKGLGVHLYQSTYDEDYLIAQWWDSLAASGEIGDVVAASAYSLSSFFQMFKPPNALAYTVKDDRMESAYWVEPVSTSPNAVFFSTWCDANTRGTKRHLTLLASIYELVFAMGRKVIVGITRHEHLLDGHGKAGYVILDAIPYLFDHDQAWVVYLTKENFECSRLYAVVNKITDKEYN